MKGLRRPVQFLVVSFSLSVAVTAQVTTGTISGTVHDQSQGVLPGVSVVVTNVETGVSRTVVSDKEGRYRAVQLPPGRYQVRAELPGFQSAIRDGIALTVGREAVVDVVLSVGEIAEHVVVTA